MMSEDDVVQGMNAEEKLVPAGNEVKEAPSKWLSPRSAALLLVTMAWFGACFIGFKDLFDYGQAEGPKACPPAQWPAGSKLQLKADGPTLVMFAHPKCPCTRSSIGELAELMAHLP